MNYEFEDTFSVKYVLLIIAILLIMLFYSSNMPEAYRAKAGWYTNLGILGLVWIGINFASKNLRDEGFMETITWGKKMLFGELEGSTKFLYIGTCIIFAVITFSTVAVTQTVWVSPPTFYQAIDLGPLNDIIFSAGAAIMENVVFFYCVFPTLFGGLNKITKTPIFAFVAALILACSIFTGYHFFNYGTVKLIETISVFGFSFISCIAIFIFRNPLFVDLWHVSNNLGMIGKTSIKVGYFILGGK